MSIIFPLFNLKLGTLYVQSLFDREIHVQIFCFCLRSVFQIILEKYCACHNNYRIDYDLSSFPVGDWKSCMKTIFWCTILSRTYFYFQTGWLYYSIDCFYYIPKWNQAFSLVDSTVQYFPRYCTIPKLNRITWKPACNKKNTILTCRTKLCIALSLVKPGKSPLGFVHQFDQPFAIHFFVLHLSVVFLFY